MGAAFLEGQGLQRILGGILQVLKRFPLGFIRCYSAPGTGNLGPSLELGDFFPL